MRRLCLILAMAFIFGSSVWVQARPNFNIDTLAFRSIPGTEGCWGYVDSATQKEYALICAFNRLEIWDVNNPSAPVLARTVSATGNDLKQVRPFSHYLFAVNQGGVGLQVIDVGQIVTNPAAVGTVKNYVTSSVPGGAHALHIDGHYAYLGMNGNGTPWRIIDISDPLNPVQVGQYSSSFGGESHDSYVKGDTAYVSFLNGGFSIVDITNKSSPQRIADVIYPSPILNHNCWTTEDGNYLFTTDEVPNGFIRVWDVRDPRNPKQVASWSAGVSLSDVHNVQVQGDFLYASYYSEGVEILDIDDPTQPIEVGHYDTDPSGGGCWDFFNFFPSGTLVASNYYGAANPGMWLLRFNGKKAAKVRGVVRNQANGIPLPGAVVRFLDVARQVTSDSTGDYFLRSEEGARQLEFSRNGFRSETLTVNTVSGDTAVLDVNLAPRHDGVLTGRVTDAGGIPLVGVRVGLFGDEFFQDVTDISGDFLLSFLPTGQLVQIAASVWGYEEKIDTLNLSNGVPLDTSFLLLRGYTDGFEFDQGWSATAPDDDATSGFWERVVPVAAFNNNTVPFQTQAGSDHTPDPGRTAFITGQAFPNASFEDHDVDGGKVTLTTPLFNLTGMNKPVLSYWRWYSNTGGQNPSKDTLFIDISTDSGASWISLEKFRFSSTSWQFRQFPLRGLAPFTSRMLVRFVAADHGGASTVEAGVDDFKVLETLVTGDIDGDGRVGLTDIVTLINAVFLGTPALSSEVGDFSGDCLVTPSDIVLLLLYFYLDEPLSPTCLGP